MRRRTGDAVLAVVEEGNHAIGVHALAGVEFIVLEVCNDLLRECLRVLLKGLHTVSVRLLELLLHSLHVALGWQYVKKN